MVAPCQSWVRPVTSRLPVPAWAAVVVRVTCTPSPRGPKPSRPSSKSAVSGAAAGAAPPRGSVKVQPSASFSVTTVCTALMLFSRLPPPSCTSTTAPGVKAARSFVVSVASERSLPSQSKMRLPRPSGCMPSAAATSPVTPQLPFGARKYGTCALGSPSASRMIFRLALRSASTCACVKPPMSAYEVLWLHSTWPSATIRRSSSAPPGA